MKNIVLLLSALLLTQFAFSQEDEKQEGYNINNRKGQFFASWGWNRSSYSKSDIEFKGDGFNFEIFDVKADDKPNSFGIKFLDPGDLTLPQTNLEVGYFIKDNYNIVFGYDHMKYIMRNGTNVKIKGEISTGNYTIDDTVYNFDGNYNNETINLSEEFLLFEHTDGLNYIFVGINRFDNFNKLLGITTNKIEVNLEEGIDLGMLMPRTNTTILGNERYDEFHVSGYGFSASAGISLTFFKRFFLKTDFKAGYINMSDIRITNDSSESAKQHFTFFETAYTFGYRFRLF